MGIVTYVIFIMVALKCAWVGLALVLNLGEE